MADAKEKGYVTTLFGRRRPVPELTSSNFMQRSFGERVAMNSPIQGTAADIIKIAMIRVNERLKAEQLRSRLILQVHDELLVEAAKEELDTGKTDPCRGDARCGEFKSLPGDRYAYRKELVRGKIDRRLQKVQKAGYKYMKVLGITGQRRGREKYDPCLSGGEIQGQSHPG